MGLETHCRLSFHINEDNLGNGNEEIRGYWAGPWGGKDYTIGYGFSHGVPDGLNNMHSGRIDISYYFVLDYTARGCVIMEYKASFNTCRYDYRAPTVDQGEIPRIDAKNFHPSCELGQR